MNGPLLKILFCSLNVLILLCFSVGVDLELCKLERIDMSENGTFNALLAFYHGIDNRSLDLWNEARQSYIYLLMLFGECDRSFAELSNKDFDEDTPDTWVYLIQ